MTKSVKWVGCWTSAGPRSIPKAADQVHDRAHDEESGGSSGTAPAVPITSRRSSGARSTPDISIMDDTMAIVSAQSAIGE